VPVCQTSVSILIALMLLLCRDVEATVAASATVPEGATAIDAAAAAPGGLQLCITYCVASTDGALGPLGDAIGTAAAAAAAAAGDVESTIGPPFPPPPGAAAEPEFTRAAAANDEAAEREVAVVAAPPPAAPPAAVDVAAIAPAWDIEPSSKSKISDVDSECIGFFIDSPVVAEIEYY